MDHHPTPIQFKIPLGDGVYMQGGKEPYTTHYQVWTSGLTPKVQTSVVPKKGEIPIQTCKRELCLAIQKEAEKLREQARKLSAAATKLEMAQDLAPEWMKPV